MKHAFISTLKMSSPNRQPFVYYTHASLHICICCSSIGCRLEVQVEFQTPIVKVAHNYEAKGSYRQYVMTTNKIVH
jgi:hypothetical protein